MFIKECAGVQNSYAHVRVFLPFVFHFAYRVGYGGISSVEILRTT